MPDTKVDLRAIAFVIFCGSQPAVDQYFAGNNGSAEFLANYNMPSGSSHKNLDDVVASGAAGHDAVWSNLLTYRPSW